MQEETRSRTDASPAATARLVIIGKRGEEHLGSHLEEAASALGISSHFLDSSPAFGHPLLHRVWWRLFGILPFSQSFSRWVVEECRRLRPALVLTTGRVPLRAQGLESLRRAGITTANFSSDDPWNPLFCRRWLLESMAAYDWVFTPRESNLEPFRSLGVPNVSYMPFAYSPQWHSRDISPEALETSNGSDVLYVGGCDADRVPYLRTIRDAGFSMSIFGGRWDRVSDLKPWARGFGGMRAIQDAVQSSKVTLVIPRHANRDGHVMRTFETAAAGGCMLVEDTPEHRAIFDADPACVVFFQGLDDMVIQLRQLVGDAAKCRRLREAVREHIVVRGQHRYQDRLASIWRQTQGHAP